MRWVVATVSVAVIFGLLDYVWLTRVGRGIYDRHLGLMLAEQPNMVAALAFYALYVVGVVFFAVKPGLAVESLVAAGIHGSLLGLVAYGTWNLTNLAVVRDWPAGLPVIDMAWGTVATGVTSVLATWVVRLTPWG